MKRDWVMGFFAALIFLLYTLLVAGITGGMLCGWEAPAFQACAALP